MTVRELVADTAERLASGGVENAGAEARWIVMRACGFDVTSMALRLNDAADPSAVLTCGGMVLSRTEGEPIQYVLGDQPFLDQSFRVGEGVLIPRPETEALTELAIGMIARSGSRVVYDLCAGSGCIGLSVAAHCPFADVYLFELSERALVFLRQNASAFDQERVHVVRHDVFREKPQRVPPPDVILSNPPYIPSSELPGLQREVQREPFMALDGGEDGLLFYRRLCGYWLELLSPGGFAAFECGEQQGERILRMLPPGFKGHTLADPFGVSRFVIAAKGD